VLPPSGVDAHYIIVRGAVISSSLQADKQSTLTVTKPLPYSHKQTDRQTDRDGDRQAHVQCAGKINSVVATAHAWLLEAANDDDQVRNNVWKQNKITCHTADISAGEKPDKALGLQYTPTPCTSHIARKSHWGGAIA